MGNFDSATLAGKLILQQLDGFVEFERNRIAERVCNRMFKSGCVIIVFLVVVPMSPYQDIKNSMVLSITQPKGCGYQVKIRIAIQPECM